MALLSSVQTETNSITKVLPLPEMQALPREVYIRQEVMPPGHYFPRHQHPWHQLLYAVSGVLIADVTGERLFIPPEKAVWLPAGTTHEVSSHYGAELKSLYIDHLYNQLPDKNQVLLMSPLIKALISEAAEFPAQYPEQGYENQVMAMILAVLPRLQQDHQRLPWPDPSKLHLLCQHLYDCPGDRRTTTELAATLNLSKRTLERRFKQATGISLQHWRQQLRLHKAIELLNAGRNVTHIAFELGYNSPSSFIYMFRQQTGLSPNRFLTTRIHSANSPDD